MDKINWGQKTLVARKQEYMVDFNVMDYTRILPLLQVAIENKATDIHMVVDKPPIFRIHGELTPSDLPALKLGDIQTLLFNMMTEAQRNIFQKNQDIDLSYIG